MAEISAQDAAFPPLSRFTPWDFGTRQFALCHECQEAYRVDLVIVSSPICPKGCGYVMECVQLEDGQLPIFPPAKLPHPPMPHEAPVKPTMSTEELRRRIREKREEQNRKASKLHDLRRAKVHPSMLDQIIPKD